MRENSPFLYNGRKLVIYGAGHDAKIIEKKLSLLSIYPAFFVTTQTQSKERITICERLYDLLSYEVLNKNEHFVIVASSKYAKEMEANLKTKSFSSSVDYIVWNIFEEDSNEKAETFFVAKSTLSKEELSNVYYTSCDSLRNVLALTTKNNKEYRIRFCFPDKNNFTLDLPELVYNSGGGGGIFIRSKSAKIQKNIAA